MGDQPKGGLFQFRKQSHSREKNAQIRLEENVQDQGLKKIVHRPSTNLSQQILVRGVRQSQRNLKNMKLKGSNLDLSASKTSASSSKIILQGWLIKRGGGGFKNWKKRWFVLKDDEISYYKSSDDHLDWNSVPDERMLVLMGVLKLKGARVIDYLEEKVGFNISSPIGDGILIQKPAITTGNGASPASSYFSRKSIKKNFMFGIETSDRNLLVKSHEEGEKTKWMNAIRDTIIKETFGPGLSLDRSASGVIDEKIKSLEISPSLIEKSESRSLSFKNLSADSAGDWEVPFSALEFENLLAEGNYGSVFKGRMWGTTVALKTLKIDVNQQEKILSDLQNEVQILSRLRHPNVVLYIGASTKLPDICIVTEWCEKGNLHDILYEDKYNIDFMLMIKFALDIAQGMNYLHSLDSQIIHRDLKSQNIIMDSNFNAKVADFGLSFKSTNDPSLTNRRDSRAEKYGVFGTPEWMAPGKLFLLIYQRR